MHLKRQKVPKKWPIARKGNKYVVRPNFGLDKGIPILIIMRDMLKIAQNRKEVKKALHLNHILLNGKAVKDEKNIAQLFDIITISPSKENYQLVLTQNGKFNIEKLVSGKKDQKIVKIIGKKMLKGKKIQLNLNDGRNFLSEIKCNVNDSIIVDLKNNKVKSCIPLKEKTNAIAFGGKHAGKKGVISKIITDKKMVNLEADEKIMKILIKHIMVTE